MRDLGPGLSSLLPDACRSKEAAAAKVKRILGVFGTSLLFLFMIFIFSEGRALALGPFSHLVFARQTGPEMIKAAGLKSADYARLEPSLFAGALALDAGYYAPGGASLGDLGHLVKPWVFCRTLRELARTPREKSFALGWLSHALLDLRAHARLVNPAVGRAFTNDPLKHKQVEWGLDCLALSREEQTWLWSLEIDLEAGLDLWGRAMVRVYGKGVDLAILKGYRRAEMKEVRRLPWVFWLGGRLERPGRQAGNLLGWALGNTVRPAVVQYLKWTEGDLDIRAVLTPQRPDQERLLLLQRVLSDCRGELRAILEQNQWPRGSLDADPACDERPCPDGVRALNWLKGIP